MRILTYVIALAPLLAGIVSCGEDDNGGTVIGTVIDADTKLPLSDARVTIGEITDVTLKDGTYRLNAVPSGEQTIVTQLAGYTTDGQIINVPENNVATLDIHLKRTGGAQPSGILLREGDQKIDVGSGPTPQISWTGGNIRQLWVYHWESTRSEWVIIWAVWRRKDGNTISSPVTYGIIPLEAEELRTDEMGKRVFWGNWVFEILRLGEKYKIEVRSAPNGTGVSTLYFVR